MITAVVYESFKCVVLLLGGLLKTKPHELVLRLAVRPAGWLGQPLLHVAGACFFAPLSKLLRRRIFLSWWLLPFGTVKPQRQFKPVA
jgi:hypothetical protein